MSKKTEEQGGKPADKWQKLNTENTAAGDIQQPAVDPERSSGFGADDIQSESEQAKDVNSEAVNSEEAASNVEIALRTKVQELEAQLLRELASQQNLRSRMEREVQSAHKYASEKFIKAMLPVVDSMERALQAPEAEGDAAMRDGMKMTIAMFEKVLLDNGVVVINPESGEVFDPDKHEAMSAQADDKQADGVILGVLQKGYDLNGRVVRAAMVVVNKL